MFIVIGMNRIAVEMTAIMLDTPKENHLLVTYTHETTAKAVIRSDQHVSIIDNEIVVGDMLSVNYCTILAFLQIAWWWVLTSSAGGLKWINCPCQENPSYFLRIPVMRCSVGYSVI